MEQDLRMNALCNRLGHLWSRTKIAVMDEVVTEESLEEGERTVFGKLYGNPEINFLAFQSAMKKAWKSEKVVFTHLEPGLFSIVFESKEERRKILEAGPWSFSRHVLILRKWEPNFVPQCFPFVSNAFWIHLVGLPVEGRKIEVIRSIAEKLGPVEDIKIETRGAAAVAVCKAKVILDLQSPLEPGMIYSYKGKEIWIDFRYERLPVFCFSCGRIGHYAQNCSEVPYDEEKFARNENIYYGTWLKTEMNSPSPYWKSFYEKPAVEEMEEEIIPETQDSPNQGKEGGEVRKKQPGVDKGKRKMNELVGNTSNRKLEFFKDSTAGATRLLLDLPSIHGIKSLEQDKKKQAVRETKKSRISNPREDVVSNTLLLDETNLMETPVESAEESNLRALVACPNKPPGYK